MVFWCYTFGETKGKQFKTPTLLIGSHNFYRVLIMLCRIDHSVVSTKRPPG